MLKFSQFIAVVCLSVVKCFYNHYFYTYYSHIIYINIFDNILCDNWLSKTTFIKIPLSIFMLKMLNLIVTTFSPNFSF